MTGKRGDSTEVRSEGESRVKGDAKDIHRGFKVRLDEVRSSDRGFSVDHEVVSKERSTSVG